MSTTTLELPAPAAHRLARGIGVLATGTAGGLVLGIVARWWMRLIAEDPEFTWSGTIFIVAAFGLFGFGTALARVARRSAHHRWVITLSRVVGGMLAMGLFGGAGAIMLPSVAVGAAARHRRDWPSWLRLVLAVLALVVPLRLIGEEADRLREPAVVLGTVLFLGTYAVIVEWLGPVAAPLGDGHRLRRGTRIAAGVVGVIGLGLVGLMLVGISTSG